MKNAIRSYFSFSRTERIGLLALSILLVLLLVVRATMAWWVQPPGDAKADAALAAQWKEWKNSHPSQLESQMTVPRKDYQDAGDLTPTPLPDIIDINTTDSATLVRLKGIGPATAQKIIQYRTAHGHFSAVEELLDAGLQERTLSLLREHLSVGNSSGRQEPDTHP